MVKANPMKYAQSEAGVLLEKLGISRWDFLPPEEGKIKFYNDSDVKVAEGDYQLLLSYGPGNKYTMAWAIDAYQPFPVAERLSQDAEAMVEPALLDDAMVKAMEIGEHLQADFVYRAATIYVAVFNFIEIASGEVEENLSQEDRLRMMREDQARRNIEKP